MDYPEVEGARNSRGYFILSSISYMLYLFGYECLFRGFLLFGLRQDFGNLPAALVSMGFVTLSHLGTALPVVLGSMVSGILFPYMAIISGSIWPVYIRHCCIGVGTDWLCVKYYVKTVEMSAALSDTTSG
jgi:membrane protease YdiL (CAAX protease family)